MAGELQVKSRRGAGLGRAGRCVSCAEVQRTISFYFFRVVAGWVLGRGAVVHEGESALSPQERKIVVQTRADPRPLLDELGSLVGIDGRQEERGA